MNQYKLFFFDPSGHVLRAQAHLLRDDLDALAVAKNFCSDHAVEVWDGIREVARVKRMDKALSTSDRRSL